MKYTAVLFAALCISMAGCSFEPAKIEVSGLVTLDDKPVKDGDIIFESNGGDESPAVAKISDGKYTILTQPGEKLVRINASERHGPVDPLMGDVPLRSIIPDRYNANSNLTAKVGADASQSDVNFELSTKD